MVVVAGRPNVGKSSLVNRIVGARAAVVEEEDGVTRDRKVLDAEWAGVPFSVMDTGGWLAGGDALDAKVARAGRAGPGRGGRGPHGGRRDDRGDRGGPGGGQGHPAVRRGRCGWWSTRSTTPTARRRPGSSSPSGWATRSRSARCTGGGRATCSTRWSPCSPGRTWGTPPEEATNGADPGLQDRGDPGTPRVAIIGRPNVGKSTLFNRLLGEERSIVHDMPGTTRDAIDTVVETPDGPVCFIDTAGLRRPSKTDRGTEHHATLRALRALERADIAVLVIDATVGASHQDQRLAERIGVSGCPAIVALNKWDQVPTDERDDVLAGVGDRLAFLGAAPVLKISALSGKGVHRILPALRDSERGLPPAGADGSAQPHGPGAPGAPGRAPGEDPLHRPGRHRPADLHALHQRAIAPDLPPLHRARAPGEVRLRRHTDEVARAGGREVSDGSP